VGDPFVQLAAVREELGFETQRNGIPKQHNEDLKTHGNKLNASITKLQTQVSIARRNNDFDFDFDCSDWVHKIQERTRDAPAIVKELGDEIPQQSNERLARTGRRGLVAWFHALAELANNPPSPHPSAARQFVPEEQDVHGEQTDQAEGSAEGVQSDHGAEPVHEQQGDPPPTENSDEDDCPKQLAKARAERDAAFEEAKRLRDLMLAQINSENAQARTADAQGQELNDCSDKLAQVQNERDDALKEANKLRDERDTALREFNASVQAADKQDDELARLRRRADFVE
jgi:hypothetical protein